MSHPTPSRFDQAAQEPTRGKARTSTHTQTTLPTEPMEPAHVALVGMPGAGKTTAGAMVAERLGMPFVDLDARIAEAAGRALPALFQEQGEVMFRARERAQLREVLKDTTPMVLACGGGTWADAAMRRELLRHARPVWLSAPLPVLLERLSRFNERQDRPLLSGPDPRAALERLYKAREPLHAHCPRFVDASRLPPDEVAQAVLTALQTPADPQRVAEALAIGDEEPGRAATSPPAAPHARQASPCAPNEAAAWTASLPAPLPPTPPHEATTTPSVLHEPPAAAQTIAPMPSPPAPPVSPPQTAHAEPAFGPPTTVFLADDVEAFVPEAKAPPPAQASTSERVAGCPPLLTVASRGGAYPIYLLDQGSPAVAEGIDAHSHGSRVAVLTDNEVAARHATPLLQALRARGLEVSLHTFAAGEESKRLSTVHHLYDELADAGHGREDTLVALGGGVVTDVAGFLASTYMRGVPLVQVPTSTLAAVDASIGGKTGLNTRRGKNLVGTFFAPQAVLVCSAYLRTQTPRAHISGLMEAVKVAAVCDPQLLERIGEQAEALLRFDAEPLREVIGQALGHKARIVGEDEHERGVRASLNYGHTFGHAIEVGEGFGCLHGEAVALGMLAEASWAEAHDLAHDVVAPLAQVLTRLGAPVQWPQARIDFDALGRDKKRMGDTLRLPVVQALGRMSILPVALDDLIDFAQATMQKPPRAGA